MQNHLALPVLVALALATVPLSSQQQARALRLEDYYRIQTVGAPTISDGAKTVTYTVSTRVESDNSTKTERWTVAVDGTGAPQPIAGDAPAGPGQGQA